MGWKGVLTVWRLAAFSAVAVLIGLQHYGWAIAIFIATYVPSVLYMLNARSGSIWLVLPGLKNRDLWVALLCYATGTIVPFINDAALTFPVFLVIIATIWISVIYFGLNWSRIRAGSTQPFIWTRGTTSKPIDWP